MLKGIVSGDPVDITRIAMKGKNLLDYNVLFDDNPDRTSTYFTYYKIVLYPNTQYTFTTDVPNFQPNDQCSYMFGTQNVMSAANDGVYANEPKTITSNPDGSVFIACRIIPNEIPERYAKKQYFDNGTYHIMLNVGSTALPYESYGYQDGWEVRDNQNRLIWGREDTITGIPPFYLRTYGLPINTWELYGNSSQSTTPTPDNPVMPEFVGVKTANLFDMSDFSSLQVTSTAYRYGTNVGVLPQGTYTFNATKSTGAQSIYMTAKLNGTYSQITISSVPFTFIADGESEYIIRTASNTGTTWEEEKYSDMMLNLGSTPLPYEPYGWAEKITCAGQTVPVYLGQTPTVRRVKKLVLTGKENWSGSAKFRIGLAGQIGTIAPICTHYRGVTTAAYGDLVDGCVTVNGGVGLTLAIYDTVNQSSLTAWKSYLADQYAAGTPVTVWYVLATPTTGIVNEPLCKIGNYVDELNSTNAEINIQTTTGINTLTVDTTLAPYDMTISGHIKQTYTYWSKIREDVRSGIAQTKFPVGTILYDNGDESTGIAFQVVAYDKHFDPSLTERGYTHSMTLCELKLNNNMIFDNIEAFLYTNTQLNAGTYKFTIPNYDATYGGNKTYYFTSTGNLVAGSQLVMRWPHNQTPKTVIAYSPTSSSVVQDVTSATTGWSALTLTEWVAGTSPEAIDLGTIAGPTSQTGTSNYGDMNHIHRARYGSNNYLQSGLRQYINSTTVANTWWKPQTIFDRPYSEKSKDGKLYKLNQDFVSVLATPTIKSRTNSYFETPSLDGTTFTVSTDYTISTDKMFLLSPVEVGFSTTDTTIGTLLDYYVNATNTDRIKRTSTGAAGVWLLRTPYPSSVIGERGVISVGSLANDITVSDYSWHASACVIQ